MATILFLVAALLQYSAAKVVYKYEGQAIIGIPESGRDANVLRIEFNVAAARIAGTSDLVVTVDPQSVKVHNYTGYLFPIPEGIVPTDKMTETIQRAESRSNLAAQLAKPMIVTRHPNGTLSNIRHDTSDVYWSVNLKRGMLSLLQINIQTDEGVYTVMEEDITGTCPSTYLVQSREHYHGHDHATPTFLNVTKSRDYTKCTNRTLLRHSFFTGITLSDEEFAEKNIITNTKFAYNITGTKAMGGLLLVDSACSEAQHIFSIFKPLSGSLAVYTHQRAKLLSVDDEAGSMPTATLMSCTWQMAIPNVMTASEDKKFADSEVVGQVRDAVGKLINPDTPNYMRGILLNRILERMRGAKLSAWQTIGEGALQASPLHTKLLLDLAPSVGTLEALQKTQEVLPRLTPNITAQFFALTSLLGEPTFQMLRTMQSICSSQYVLETTREAKACHLAYASMIYNRYFRSGYYLKNATFSQEEKAAIAEFTALVDRKHSEVQGNLTAMLLWIKFAGNLGWNRLIPQLKAFAKNESYPIVVRVHAIRAFRRIPAAFHGEIANILLPIFTDWHNDVEIRIAAYRGIMGASPSQAMLDLISNALHHEHDEHVRTYVYSHLMTLTRNQLVSEIPLSDRARVTLEGLTSIIPTGMQYSRYMRCIDTYDDDRNAGFTLDVSIVGNTRSLLPREMCIWARGVAFGVQGNMAHICLRLQGVQKALQKVLRTAGPVYPDFFAQLGLNQIEYEDYHGMLDFSVEGSELQFLEIPPFITQAMNDPAVLQQRVASAIQMLRTPIFKTVVLDGTLQMPTLLGIPVQQNNTYAWHLNVSLGQVGFVPACRFNPYQPCQITMKPQGIYQLGSQHSLGVDAGIVQSKVLLHGMVSRSRGEDRNWTISYSRNQQNMTVSFEANLPRARTTTAHTEVMPFLITVDRTKPTLDEQLYIKEWNAWHAGALADHNFQIQLNTTAKLTGFLFGFNKTHTKCVPFMLLPASKPQYPFCGKVVRDFYVIPQADAPEKMQITFRSVGPPLTTISQSAETLFRSNDAAAVHDDDEGHHDMMVELGKLSRSLNQELSEVDEMRDHLQADMREEDSFAVEEEVIDESEETLSRHRRSVYKPGRKDRKPGVGRDRIPRPTGDPDSFTRQRITDQTSSMSLDILGFNNGAVTRKIELASSRVPTSEPKQFQRDFTIKATVGGRQVGSFCGKATVQYPRGYVALQADRDAGAEPSWSYVSKVTYGTDRCESDKTMELHINFSRSDEQKLATQLFRSNSPAANRFYILRMCQEEMAKGQTYTWPCRHLFHELNEAHRLDIKIKANDHKKLQFGDVDMRNWISAFFLHLRVHHWHHLRTSFVRDIKHDSKEISFSSQRNFQLPLLVDFTIKSPETTSQFQNVYLRHHPPSLYFNMMYSAVYHMSGFRLPGTCVAHKTVANRMYVSTFDNVVYNGTAPTCPDGVTLNILLAADCSSSSKFAVYIKFDSTTKEMELNVLTAAHQVRLKPMAKAGGAEVYVDNTKVVDEKYTAMAGDNELVIKNFNGVVQVRLSIGVYVTLQPDYAVMIGLTPLYSGLTCGICGDYNGQQLDEFTMADGTLTDNAKLFHTSYVAGIEQCTV